jgi:hypothetical protein
MFNTIAGVGAGAGAVGAGAGAGAGAASRYGSTTLNFTHTMWRSRTLASVY